MAGVRLPCSVCCRENTNIPDQSGSSVPFGYFPCPVPDPEQLTADILEEIAPETAQWQFLREFAQLELSPDLLWQPFRTLSGGEQTKILLAALFLREGCFPLIDEPTNHLDTHGREILSRWLQRQKGYILISHDRAFLDSCTDHILSLNRSSVEVQAGRFSDWLENFQRRQQSEEEQSQRLQKEIRRLRDSARRASDWSDRRNPPSSAADRWTVDLSGIKLPR